jgi:hypothetical protein
LLLANSNEDTGQIFGREDLKFLIKPVIVCIN